MSKFDMDQFVKQYQFYAVNSAVNFNIGGRTGGTAAKMPVSSASTISAASDDSPEEVGGRAVSAAVDGEDSNAEKNALVASATTPAVDEKHVCAENNIAGENNIRSDETADIAKSLKSGSLFQRENLLKGIIMAEILGKPKYYRKGRW